MIPVEEPKIQYYAERFWTKVNKTESCWLWQAYVDPRGYGRFHANNRGYRAHQFAYLLTKGKVPDGLEIDHLCGVKNCVNPDHLEAVTHQENILRGNAPAAKFARRDQCSKGHLFTDENTRIHWGALGARVCKQCAYESSRVFRIARGREATNAYNRKYYAENRERLLERMKRIRDAKK